MRVRRFWLSGFAVALLSLLLAMPCSNVYAEAPDGRVSRDSSNSFASLIWFAVPGKSGAIANSSSVLIRNDNGVSYHISTTGLLAGGAYTNWWVIFNNPESCSAPACGLKDLPQNGGDPNVQASVVWATGRVVDANGQGTFSAHLLVGRALLDAHRADILLIVRSHGLALSGADLNAQLTTLQGGCKINTCRNEQFVRHLAGEN